MATNLPRDIIKWIQGLDLSYSVKDTRRDLSNGFLIAEIFSRYYPGQIQMHSFDNSQNRDRRINNWTLLDKFFQKNELPFSKRDYEKILNDNDMSQLIEFMIKCYQQLTSKKINKHILDVIVQGTKRAMLNNENEGGASFLLKDKGLERLNKDDIKEIKPDDKKDKDIKKEEKLRDIDDQTSMNSKQNASTMKNFLRVQIKKIQPTNEVPDFHIESKSSAPRPVNVNIAKLRASKEISQSMNKSQILMNHSSQDHLQMGSVFNDNNNNMLSPGQQHMTIESTKSKKEKPVEKGLYEILNDLLHAKLASNTFLEDMKKMNVKNTSFLTYFLENIDHFSDSFISNVLKEICDKADGLAVFIMRDANELWKFYNFMLSCLKGLEADRESFKNAVELFYAYIPRFMHKDPQKSRSIFEEYFLVTFGNIVIQATLYEKKQQIVPILYLFCANNPESKFQIIGTYKLALNNPFIFIQSLVILINQEATYQEDSNKSFYNNFLYFAKAGMISSSPKERLNAIAIFCKLAQLKHELILEYTLSKFENWVYEEWWENKILLFLLGNRLIRGITESENYKNLIKKANPQMNKNYNLENELMIAKLKGEVEKISKCMVDLSKLNNIESVLKCFIVNSIDHIGESKVLLKHMILIVLNGDEEFRKWFYYNDDPTKEEYLIFNDKSMKHRVGINSEDLKKYSKDILVTAVDIIKAGNYDSLDAPFFEFLEFGLRNTDFKLLNTEVLNNIVVAIVNYIFIALVDENLCDIAAKILKLIYSFSFKGETRLKDLEVFYANAFYQIFKNNLQHCIENMHELISWIQEEIDTKKLDRERLLLNEILTAVIDKCKPEFEKELTPFLEFHTNTGYQTKSPRSELRTQNSII